MISRKFMKMMIRRNVIHKEIRRDQKRIRRLYEQIKEDNASMNDRIDNLKSKSFEQIKLLANLNGQYQKSDGLTFDCVLCLFAMVIIGFIFITMKLQSLSIK